MSVLIKYTFIYWEAVLCSPLAQAERGGRAHAGKHLTGDRTRTRWLPRPLPALLPFAQKRESNACALAASEDRSVGALARRHSSASLGTDTFTGHSGTCPGSRRRYSSKANSERGPHRARLLHQSLQEGIPGAWLRGCPRGFPSGSPATQPSGISLQGWLWAAFPSRDALLLSACPRRAAGSCRRGTPCPLFPHTVLRFNHGESCPPAMLSKPRKKKDKEQPRLRRQG